MTENGDYDYGEYDYGGCEFYGDCNHEQHEFGDSSCDYEHYGNFGDFPTIPRRRDPVEEPWCGYEDRSEEFSECDLQVESEGSSNGPSYTFPTTAFHQETPAEDYYRRFPNRLDFQTPRYSPVNPHLQVEAKEQWLCDVVPSMEFRGGYSAEERSTWCYSQSQRVEPASTSWSWPSYGVSPVEARQEVLGDEHYQRSPIQSELNRQHAVLETELCSHEDSSVQSSGFNFTKLEANMKNAFAEFNLRMKEVFEMQTQKLLEILGSPKEVEVKGNGEQSEEMSETDSPTSFSGNIFSTPKILEYVKCDKDFVSYRNENLDVLVSGDDSNVVKNGESSCTTEGIHVTVDFDKIDSHVELEKEDVHVTCYDPGIIDELHVKDLRLQLPGKENALSSIKNPKSTNSFNSSHYHDSVYTFMKDECPRNFVELLEKYNEDRMMIKLDEPHSLNGDNVCFDPGIIKKLDENSYDGNGLDEGSLICVGSSKIVEGYLKCDYGNFLGLNPVVRPHGVLEFGAAIRYYDPGIPERCGVFKVDYESKDAGNCLVEVKVLEFMSCRKHVSEQYKTIECSKWIGSILCFDPGIVEDDRTAKGALHDGIYENLDVKIGEAFNSFTESSGCLSPNFGDESFLNICNNEMVSNMFDNNGALLYMEMDGILRMGLVQIQGPASTRKIEMVLGFLSVILHATRARMHLDRGQIPVLKHDWSSEIIRVAENNFRAHNLKPDLRKWQTLNSECTVFTIVTTEVCLASVALNISGKLQHGRIQLEKIDSELLHKYKMKDSGKFKHVYVVLDELVTEATARIYENRVAIGCTYRKRVMVQAMADPNRKDKLGSSLVADHYVQKFSQKYSTFKIFTWRLQQKRGIQARTVHCTKLTFGDILDRNSSELEDKLVSERRVQSINSHQRSAEGVRGLINSERKLNSEREDKWRTLFACFTVVVAVICNIGCSSLFYLDLQSSLSLAGLNKLKCCRKFFKWLVQNYLNNAKAILWKRIGSKKVHLMFIILHVWIFQGMIHLVHATSYGDICWHKVIIKIQHVIANVESIARIFYLFFFFIGVAAKAPLYYECIHTVLF